LLGLYILVTGAGVVVSRLKDSSSARCYLLLITGISALWLIIGISLVVYGVYMVNTYEKPESSNEVYADYAAYIAFGVLVLIPTLVIGGCGVFVAYKCVAARRKNESPFVPLLTTNERLDSLGLGS
jgi:uncharacterized membrane protein YhaH (DUF805 family)